MPVTVDMEIPSTTLKVLNDLQDTNDLLREEVSRELVSIAGLFTSQITEYPPETAGNNPPPPYYSRGVGYIRRGNVINPVSEQFGDNVSFRRLVNSEKEVSVLVSLRPSYSKWLVGSTQQAWFHARNGWKTIRQVLRGLDIDADETTNAAVPATQNIRMAVNSAMSKLKKYS